MSTDTVYPVPAGVAAGAWTDQAAYRTLYRASIDDPAAFWAEQAQRLDWIKPFRRSRTSPTTPGICTSGGSLTASSTWPPTVWTGIWSSGDIRLP